MDVFSYIQSILLLCIALFFLFSITIRPKSDPNKPPGPTPLPVFGNLLGLLPHINTPHKYFAKLAKTYGPIMTLKLGSIPAFVISTPGLAKQVLHRNHHIFSTLYDLDAVRAHEHHNYSIGPLSASSPKWKILRKIYSTQLLSEKMLEKMQIHRYKKLDDLLGYIKKCSQAKISLDVGQAINDASYNMIASTIFSLDLSNDVRMRHIKELMDCIIKEIGRPNIVDCYPILKFVDPQGIRHRLTYYCVELFKLFDEIIEERLKVKKDQGKSVECYNDLMDVILDVAEEQRDEIKKEHVHHLLLDLLGAGMDTTAKTIEWAMAEVLRNPNVLRKMQEEINSVVGKDQKVLESNISKLPYLQAIVKETLRLHPAAPLLLPRKVEQDVEIDGYQLPKGAMLIVNAWAIGRDPQSWADPDTFYPERFLGSELDMKTQFMKLFTFGAGKKICVGMPLALRMIALVLGNLVSSFDWKVEDFEGMDLGSDFRDLYGITLKKTESLHAFPIAR